MTGLGDSDINTDLFIISIKKHNCIWNYRMPEYSNKGMKSEAWSMVCGEVVPDFETKSPSEKKSITIQLQNRWKILRDGFTRYIRTLKKKSGSANPIKQYTYYNELMFLNLISKVRRSNVDPLTDTEKTDSRKRKRKSEICDIQAKRSDIQSNDCNRPTQQCDCEDEDKLFLLSLLSDFKKIADHYKLDAKGEIIQTIKNYRDISAPPPTKQSAFNFMGYPTGSPDFRHQINYTGPPSSTSPEPQMSPNRPQSETSSYDNVTQDFMMCEVKVPPVHLIDEVNDS